ncbi:MAG: hypothetical protein WAV05_17675 [Anaerolineales bacterium]
MCYLHVRNHTPLEMETPGSIPTITIPVIASPTLVATTPTLSAPTHPALPPTVSHLPVNPAEISSSQIIRTNGKSAIFTVGCFLLLAAYLGIRKILYHRK